MNPRLTYLSLYALVGAGALFAVFISSKGARAHVVRATCGFFLTFVVKQQMTTKWSHLRASQRAVQGVL